MRIPASCDHCHGRAMVYATVRHATFVVRYRRCDSCGTTSKTISLKSILSSIQSVEQVGAPVTIDAGGPNNDCRTSGN